MHHVQTVARASPYTPKHPTVGTGLPMLNAKSVTNGDGAMMIGTVQHQHQIFTKGGWRRARFSKHPTVRLRLSIDHAAPSARRYGSLVTIDVDAVTDS